MTMCEANPRYYSCDCEYTITGVMAPAYPSRVSASVLDLVY